MVPVDIEVKESIDEILISMNEFVDFFFEVDLEIRYEIRNMEIKI